MTWERVSNFIGAGLVAVCFVVSLGRVLTLRQGERAGGSGGPVTLRIAHFQLEAGVREALDEIARRYRERHPNVRIVQMQIPEKIFRNWRLTQLVGRTPPDLMQLGAGISEAQLARYFLPLSDLANQPNPHNAGTPLEKARLRETLFDGMQAGLGGDAGGGGLQVEYYGVPITAGTFRMFYNTELLREITGKTEVPATYEEFVRLCGQAREFSRRTGRKILPLGGSGQNANLLMDFLFSGQTQRLLQEKINKTGQMSSLPSPARVARAYREGLWSLRSPEVLSGLELVRRTAGAAKPGFDQLQRDDAVFHFSQGSELAIPAGSWDAVSLQTFCPFSLSVGPLPLPDTADPEFGKFALGRISEAERGGILTFGIPRDARHPEIARDFLLFLASAGMNKVWTDVSQWPPAVVGVEPSPEVRQFMPREGGFPPGFPLNGLGADTRRLFMSNLLRMIGPQASVEGFVAALEGDFGRALEADLRRQFRAARDALRRSDSVEASLTLRAARDPSAAAQLDRLIQARIAIEQSATETLDALAVQP